MSDAYYLPVAPGVYEPTLLVGGVWRPDEQHMAPVSGLICHAIDRHEPREDMALARISFDILGVIARQPVEVEVRTIRPGRTIELVEAVLSIEGRPAVRARAWRLARQDTEAVAGGEVEPLPEPETFEPMDMGAVWGGDFLPTLEVRRSRGAVPGRGQAWARTEVPVVAGEEVSPTARLLGIIDIANGIVVRSDPREWMFPNVDLTLHLHREPVPGWVGLDTRVVFGGSGLGVTTSTVHDSTGPVGRLEQSLTVRAPLR